MKTKTRGCGITRVEIAGEKYTFRMSQAGLTIRRKWARHTTIVKFHDLLAHSQGQLVLPLKIT
jgi:hypothetical protein